MKLQLGHMKYQLQRGQPLHWYYWTPNPSCSSFQAATKNHWVNALVEEGIKGHTQGFFFLCTIRENEPEYEARMYMTASPPNWYMIRQISKNAWYEQARQMNTEILCGRSAHQSPAQWFWLVSVEHHLSFSSQTLDILQTWWLGSTLAPNLRQ